MYYFAHGEYFMLIKIISGFLVGVCDLIDNHHVQSDHPCYLAFQIALNSNEYFPINLNGK